MVVQLLVPMAGAGSRFAKAGFSKPKPLINVHGKAMIQIVIGNLAQSQHVGTTTFIVQESHLNEYSLPTLLGEWVPGCQIVPLAGLTRGAAESCLAASKYIDGEQPLVIANSDQYVDCDIDDFYIHAISSGNAGSILCMESDDPKWSYIELNSSGSVAKVVEKEVISNLATVGIYYFAKASDFFYHANAMVEDGELSNGEFYVAPVYNRIIAQGGAIDYVNLGPDGEVMHGLGTPEDLTIFLASPVSERAVID